MLDSHKYNSCFLDYYTAPIVSVIDSDLCLNILLTFVNIILKLLFYIIDSKSIDY